jgi:hypothetical protein
VIDLIALFMALILVPAGLMLLIRPVGRAAFFLIGLVFFFGIGFVMELGGPDSPGLIIPFLGLAISAGALLSEMIVRVSKLMKRRAPTHG